MTINDKITQLVSRFDSHKDWEDKYRELIKTGKGLEELDKNLQVSKFEVKGCQSKVWLVPKLEKGIVIFKADSDAILVKGIIAILLEVYSYQKPEAILNSPPSFLKEIGITDHLSMNRTNGLASMVKQIQMYATLFKALIDKGIEDADI